MPTQTIITSIEEDFRQIGLLKEEAPAPRRSKAPAPSMPIREGREEGRDANGEEDAEDQDESVSDAYLAKLVECCLEANLSGDPFAALAEIFEGVADDPDETAYAKAFAQIAVLASGVHGLLDHVARQVKDRDLTEAVESFEELTVDATDMARGFKGLIDGTIQEDVDQEDVDNELAQQLEGLDSMLSLFFETTQSEAYDEDEDEDWEDDEDEDEDEDWEDDEDEDEDEDWEDDEDDEDDEEGKDDEEEDDEE